jgi:hypothetical protein
MMQFDPIPDPFAPSPEKAEEEQRARLAAEAARDAAAEPEKPTADETKRRARDAEVRLTSALAELKQKGARTVERVESTLGPATMIVGAAIAAGLGAVLLFAVVRAARPRRRRRPTLLGTVTRSIAREAAGRMVLGAATTVGARLAETVLVPALVASVSARAATQQRAAKAARPRKSRKVVVPVAEIDDDE